MVSKWLTWPCHDHKTNAVSRIGAPPLPRGMIAPHSVTASSRAADSRPAGGRPWTIDEAAPASTFLRRHGLYFFDLRRGFLPKTSPHLLR